MLGVHMEMVNALYMHLQRYPPIPAYQIKHFLDFQLLCSFFPVLRVELSTPFSHNHYPLALLGIKNDEKAHLGLFHIIA